MNDLVIPTKLHVPRLPARAISRPRLEASWETWADKRLILITAGAGFGKTSFVAARARTSDRPCAWFALDELDQDVHRFAAHLLRTVRRAAGEAVPADEDEADLQPEQVLAQVVRVLRDCPRGCLLVLDDVHLVAPAAPVLGLIERLVRFLPEGATVVLVSRERLDLPSMRLRSQGRVASLEGGALGFDAEELERFIALRLPDTEFRPRHLRSLASLTEGWAAGLEMFCQVMGDDAARGVDEVLDGLDSAGAGWFDYFAEEVLTDLDDRTRAFLLHSSLLPRLEADLCRQVLGEARSEAILTDLCRRNLFTFPTEDGHYRYHHLFREFLHTRLVETSDRDELQRLQRRAGRALAKRKSWVEAIIAFAEAGDEEAVSRLLDRRGEGLLRSGRFTALTRVLDGMPVRHVNSSPSALLVRGRIHEIQGRWPEAEKAYRKALRLDVTGSRRVELLSLLARLLILQGRYRAGMRMCRQALDEPGRMKTRIRARILGMQGIAYADTGRIDEAERHLNQAAAIYRRKAYSIDEARTLYLLAANVYIPRGDFEQAKRLSRKAVVISRKLEEPLRICHSLGVLGWVLVMSGDHREGRTVTETALRLAENLEYHTMLGICRYTLGLYGLITGDLASARGHYESARELGARLGEAELRSIPHLGLASVALADGNRHAARKHARRALEIVKETRDVKTEAQCHVLLGRLAAATDVRRAEVHWGQAERLLRRFGAVFELSRLQLHRLDAGRPDQVDRRRRIADLLSSVAEHGHEPLFTIFEPAAAARVLTQALRLGVEADYVTGLLVRLGKVCVPELSAAVAQAGEEAKHAAELCLRAVDILTQIGGESARVALADLSVGLADNDATAGLVTEKLEAMPDVPLRIRALGPLVLDVGDRTLEFRTWRSKRALRLFQVLLVNRFKWMTKDVLLEALWPDGDLAKATNNLRQSVYLLRKLLEPDLPETKLSHYILQHHDTYRLEAGTGFDYDVLDFEDLLSGADAHAHAGRIEEAQADLRAAIALYRDDFMCESPYEELVAFEREQLRDRLLQALAKIVDMHVRAGQWRDALPFCRRGLELDAFNESLYHHLLQAHYRLGDRREALEAYHRYERMMMQEFDLLPSAEMRSLVDKVMALDDSPGQP